MSLSQQKKVGCEGTWLSFMVENRKILVKASPGKK
jgi:hypothetical protein